MKDKNKKVVEEEQVVVVKRRVKVTNILIVLIVLYVIGLYAYKLVVAPINNIYVSNNKYLTDQEVIDTSGIRNYPSFILTTKYQMKKKLLKNEMVESVKIRKKLDRSVTIEINEATPLFIYKDKIVLSNGKEINNKSYELPLLINNLNNEIMNKLIDKYQDINDEIKMMISEIEYVPNDIDKERFLITMNDGNYVYITLYKTTSINEYIKIISNKEIENKKGILYLDSGNYFETLE